MGNPKPANECIRIGSIFRYESNGECGSSRVYYQVVGLRGKTLVELRKLRTKEYVDSRCVKTEEEQRRFLEENPGKEFTHTWWDYLVWCRPLPGQFDGEAFTVRALKPGGYDGKNRLRGIGEDNWRYFWETDEDDEGRMTGYDGGYARIELKKKGELPSWAELP